MSQTCIYLQYGDSSEHEFGAWVDDALPLRNALAEPIRKAIESGLLPKAFAEETYNLEHAGSRVDLRGTLAQAIARVGNGDGAWTLLDDHAPQLIQVVARVDGSTGRARSAILTMQRTPPRSLTLKEAIAPAELVNGARIAGQQPIRWWIRSAWPGRRLWWPWTRWNTRVSMLRRNEMVELVPDLREWRCYKTQSIVAAIVVLASVIALALLLWFRPWSRRVEVINNNVPVTLIVENQLIPVERSEKGKDAARPWSRRIPANVRTVTVLPNERPLFETDASTIRLPDTRGKYFISLKIQCFGARGTTGGRCPDELKLNNVSKGSLMNIRDAFTVPAGPYVIEVSPCKGFDLITGPNLGVVSVVERRAGMTVVNFKVPPDSVDVTAKEATITIYCKGSTTD